MQNLLARDLLPDNVLGAQLLFRCKRLLNFNYRKPVHYVDVIIKWMRAAWQSDASFPTRLPSNSRSLYDAIPDRTSESPLSPCEHGSRHKFCNIQCNVQPSGLARTLWVDPLISRRFAVFIIIYYVFV